MNVVAICRGEGLGYLAVAASEAQEGLVAQARLASGDTVPCSLFSVESAAERERIAPKAAHLWVVVVPLLSRACVVELANETGVLLRTNFPTRGSKVASRVLSATKPQVAAALRGYEQRHAHGGVQVRIAEAWPADAGKVAWRVHVAFPAGSATGEGGTAYEPAGTPAAPASATTSSDAWPALCAFGEDARPLDATVVLMENHEVPDERDPALPVRQVTFSALLPEDARSFFVVARLGTLTGFAGMNAPRAAGMVEHARFLTAGAPADPRYEAWFEERRATTADLNRQRAACNEATAQGPLPLMSIVMPVFRPRREFFEAALRSVLAQSYPAWELVAANASGQCEDVDAVLSAATDDPRVRVLSINNRSISENTNAGIAAARGDYVAFLDHDDVLEPDALWHYYQALLRDPTADLLYSDEDHLAGTHVHAPAFKTFPNYGKLYAHNYVTHLLMVSRRVLELTERSGPEVAGAQDYDLTLKAFEVARSVVHIPRVLYHWREHEGSTSGGGDQKPFAHEAGRRALAAHLARRAIAAQVDDGPLPYTYRVRYELPTPPELVSVVIPTRDQAELLRTCVTSILERSTYPHLEVVLVENNSEQAQTFALYDKLTARDAHVRVVTWTPSEPGAFNYSAIVNYGVAQAKGSLVVLLNNDTEVIEPAWLEEMAGCAMRPEVGVVGAKLLFGDGLIQHVGMVANANGDNCHVCQNLTRDALGAGYAALMPGDYSMVTGACQLVRRQVFDELGGYDEQLAVGFNDTDFCLRAREAGYSVAMAPHALLRHREFSTRGREAADLRLRERALAEKAYTMARHARFYAEGDPALNPNLDGYSPYFALS